jgi:hypothetical protein
MVNTIANVDTKIVIVSIEKKRCMGPIWRNRVKDTIAKMLQPFLMTTFSSSLFVGQGGRAKEDKESL